MKYIFTFPRQRVAGLSKAKAPSGESGEGLSGRMSVLANQCIDLLGKHVLLYPADCISQVPPAGSF